MSPWGVWKVSPRNRINQVPAYKMEQLFTDDQILALETPGNKQQPMPCHVFAFCLHLAELSRNGGQGPAPAVLQTLHPFPAGATGEGNSTCFVIALSPPPQGTEQEMM